jgi:hypothetical protein
MRLSLLTSLGLAAFLGIMAMDAPDANAIVRRTVVSTPGRTAVITTRRSGRLAMLNRWRGARGSVICRTRVINGVRVRRCT